MSTTVHASTQPELSTTLPSYEDDDVLHKRLDFISVAIICGVILICFFICIVIGCRRTKRRRPPRCQDISTPPMESSRSGTFCVISGPRAAWLTHCSSISRCLWCLAQDATWPQHTSPVSWVYWTKTDLPTILRYCRQFCFGPVSIKSTIINIACIIDSIPYGLGMGTPYFTMVLFNN